MCERASARVRACERARMYACMYVCVRGMHVWIIVDRPRIAELEATSRREHLRHTSEMEMVQPVACVFVLPDALSLHTRTRQTRTHQIAVDVRT